MTNKEKLDAAIKALIGSGVKPRGLDGTLFNVAKSYHEVAELALLQISSTRNADFAAPAIMCRSFAIELLLKFFIAVDYPHLSLVQTEYGPLAASAALRS